MYSDNMDPPDALNSPMRDYLVKCMDINLRRHPDCGVVLTGDLNQFKDTFLRTHYSLKQFIRNPTRKNAILDKIWTNMEPVYETPVVLGKLGTSDHRMVLLVATSKHTLDTGTTLQACEEQLHFFQETMAN